VATIDQHRAPGRGDRGNVSSCTGNCVSHEITPPHLLFSSSEDYLDSWNGVIIQEMMTSFKLSFHERVCVIQLHDAEQRTFGETG
jgi:hypothetical protein